MIRPTTFCPPQMACARCPLVVDGTDGSPRCGLYELERSGRGCPIPGPWRIMRQDINGRRMYIAGKWMGISEPLHGGNIKYYGGYSDIRGTIEALVAELNARRGGGDT